VSARQTGEYVNESPLLEVYILKGELSAELDSDDIRRSSSMRRNVNVGDNKLVRIDVTEAVLFFLANPESNYGLAVGSLSNSRDGLFTLKSNSFPGGGVARIRFHY
jgi:hypothetical protein